MRVVYIASPYTIGDVAVNVKAQMDIANALINLGYCPYAPLLSHFLHMNNPQPYERWMDIDFEMVTRCDIVLRLPGNSSGADREVCFAKSKNIPVVFSLSELIAIEASQKD